LDASQQTPETLTNRHVQQHRHPVSQSEHQRQERTRHLVPVRWNMINVSVKSEVSSELLTILGAVGVEVYSPSELGLVHGTHQTSVVSALHVRLVVNLSVQPQKVV